MSNITSIFNPPKGRDLSDDECLGCTVVQLVVSLCGGLYFLSPYPFRDKAGLVDLKKHPLWFQRSVRGAGIGLVALAMYRVGEMGQIWYKRR